MLYRSKNERISDLFDSERGRPIFRTIMSKQTFQYVNSTLRFDDVYGRRQQVSADKFAPIRDLFEKWSAILPDYYNPQECVTIDEQLLKFPSQGQGRCGLTFWRAVCAETCYVWKIQPNLREASAQHQQRERERAVLNLVDGLNGHNITMDKTFTSYRLGQQLLSKNLTMNGRIKLNQRSIPPELRECKQKPLYQSKFAFTKDTTLVSYVEKKNKCAIYQSTLHSSSRVKSDGKRLPEIIDYYNKTKGLL